MKPELPKYCFARGNRIWVRLKREDGAWKNSKTPYTLDQVEHARKFVAGALKAIEARRAGSADGVAIESTVRGYANRWLKDRESRGIASAKDEKGRLERYALPYIGDLELEAVRPRHVRDLVRELKDRKGDDKLAPRTILHVFRALHNMFESAIVDELILANPVKVKRGELPKKIDADPEWRSQATFTVREVERLISDPLIPVERRVLYALKAIAGLRHGEAAALCWRHVDQAAEPLARINVVQAFCSRTHVVKSTKTEETRVVPMHPTLAKVLASWKLEHWERIYGRKPTDDDFVVPARTFHCVNAADAGHSMLDDLDALGLRKEAGKHRHRGGHDLRSWYKTRLIEDGADSLIVRRTTHAPPKDVDGGYERFSWATMCREVGKLKVEILDGKVLPLVTDSFRAEKKAGARWTSMVTPKGLENDGASVTGTVSVESGDPIRIVEDTVGRPAVTGRYISTAAKMLERAIRAGDLARAMRIVNEMRGRGEQVDALEAG